MKLVVTGINTNSMHKDAVNDGQKAGLNCKRAVKFAGQKKSREPVTGCGREHSRTWNNNQPAVNAPQGKAGAWFPL